MRTNDTYEDILHHPHHRSKRHPHMSAHDRAAQFSPFAALTRFGAAIQETARQTTAMPTLSEDEKTEIDRILHQALAEPARTLSIDYFIPDERKEGGQIETVQGHLARVNAVHRSLTLKDGTTIPIDCITGACIE